MKFVLILLVLVSMGVLYYVISGRSSGSNTNQVEPPDDGFRPVEEPREHTDEEPSQWPTQDAEGLDGSDDGWVPESVPPPPGVHDEDALATAEEEVVQDDAVADEAGDRGHDEPVATQPDLAEDEGNPRSEDDLLDGPSILDEDSHSTPLFRTVASEQKAAGLPVEESADRGTNDERSAGGPSDDEISDESDDQTSEPDALATLISDTPRAPDTHAAFEETAAGLSAAQVSAPSDPDEEPASAALQAPAAPGGFADSVSPDDSDTPDGSDTPDDSDPPDDSDAPGDLDEGEDMTPTDEALEETADGTQEDAPETTSRTVSELHEVVDGGFGIGSAALIEDGAQPLGHPIKANFDTRTYQDLHSPWYDQTEPDVWFLDPGYAERAGFRRAE